MEERSVHISEGLLARLLLHVFQLLSLFADYLQRGVKRGRRAIQ